MAEWATYIITAEEWDGERKTGRSACQKLEWPVKIAIGEEVMLSPSVTGRVIRVCHWIMAPANRKPEIVVRVDPARYTALMKEPRCHFGRREYEFPDLPF